MMLPSALPIVGLHAATQWRVPSPAVRAIAVPSFVLTHLALWAVTGLPLYFAGLGLMVVAPRTLAYVTAGVLLVVGVRDRGSPSPGGSRGAVTRIVVTAEHSSATWFRPRPH